MSAEELKMQFACGTHQDNTSIHANGWSFQSQIIATPAGILCQRVVSELALIVIRPAVKPAVCDVYVQLLPLVLRWVPRNSCFQETEADQAYIF